MKYEPKDYHAANDVDNDNADDDVESRSSSSSDIAHESHTAVPQPSDDGGVPHRRVSQSNKTNINYLYYI